MKLSLFLVLLSPGLLLAANLYPTIPGTDTPDRSRGYASDGNVAYPMIKGTSTPDRGSREAFVIEGDQIYRAIPGTRTPDRSRAWRGER